MGSVSLLPFVSPEAFANDVAAGAFNEAQAGYLGAVLEAGGLRDLASAVQTSHELRTLPLAARRELRILVEGLARRDEPRLRRLLAARQRWRRDDRLAEAGRFGSLPTELIAGILAKQRMGSAAYATMAGSSSQNARPARRGEKLEAMIIDGPGGSISIVDISGRERTINIYVWTVPEFVTHLQREGYDQDRIDRLIAQLEWNWLKARRATRLASEKYPDMPENWKATGELKYVSVSVNASDGTIVEWRPLGDLSESERAVWRPNDRD